MTKGIFITMHMRKDATIEDYKDIMPKIIRIWKKKYNVTEYIAALEESKNGYKHIHMYMNKQIYVLALKEEWNKLAKTGAESMDLVIVKSDAEVKIKLDYIRKDPIILWICQEYKNKYNWISGDVRDNPLIKGKIEEQIQQVQQVQQVQQDQQDKLLKEQMKLERNQILKTVDILKKGLDNKSYIYNIKVIKGLIPYIDNYIVKEKKISSKKRELLLLNLIYFCLQLEGHLNYKNEYIHEKIGYVMSIYKGMHKELYEKIEKKYNKEWLELLNIQKILAVEKLKNLTQDITKDKIIISYKQKMNLMFSFVKNKEEWIEYKESVKLQGIKIYGILLRVFFEPNERFVMDYKLVLKKEIKKKVDKILLNFKKIYIFKEKIPLIVKPETWDINKKGGYYTEELKKSLIKKNINSGNNLVVKPIIYKIINKLQNVEYSVNKKFLEFVIDNKEQIFNILLKKYDKGNKEYNDILWQYNKTLEIAEMMSKYEKFYFTYELDYRGRVHGVQNYFHYQGNKLARSLIQFANEKKKVFYWFTIAISALYKGAINNSYEELEDFYYDKIRKKWNFKNWYEYFKDADEPMLFLSIFYEMKQCQDLVNDNDRKGGNTKHILWLDATSSGSQIISLLTNSNTFNNELHLEPNIIGERIKDYYTYIYSLYNNKFEKIQEIHIRKIIKKIVMTINYGLTRKGCHIKMRQLLKEYGYCNDNKTYKKKWYLHVEDFYNFLCNLDLVKGLNILQSIWNLYCKNRLTYKFRIGEFGLCRVNWNLESLTLIYEYKYNNFSLYNWSNKKNTKRFKYKWHMKKMDRLKQRLKVKANLIHLIDAEWNLMLIKAFENDIACIHDCFGMHSLDICNFDKVIKNIIFGFSCNKHQYYLLLNDMLENYYKLTKDKENYEELSKIVEKYRIKEYILDDKILKSCYIYTF